MGFSKGYSDRVRAILIPAALALATACGGQDPVPIEEPASAPDPVRQALSEPPVTLKTVERETNARRGRILFVTKGCVICHQVNDVGGTAATALVSAAPAGYVDPVDFSARIWRGARAMTALQSIELGYVIELDGEDIADLAAFVASPDERALLKLDSVSREMRDWFINEPYWLEGDWDEYSERGERIPLPADPER